MDGDWASTLGEFDARDYEHESLIAQVRNEVRLLARGLLLEELSKRLLADLGIIQRSLLNNEWEESQESREFKVSMKKLVASRLPDEILKESWLPDGLSKDRQSFLACPLPYLRFEGGEVILDDGHGKIYSGLFAKGGNRLSLDAVSSDALSGRIVLSPKIEIWASAIHSDMPYCCRLPYEFGNNDLDIDRYFQGGYTSNTDVEGFIKKNAGRVSSGEMFEQFFPPKEVAKFFPKLYTTVSPQDIWRAIGELVSEAYSADFRVMDLSSSRAMLDE